MLFGVGTNVQAGWVLAIAALLIGILVAGLILPLRGLHGVKVGRRTPRTAVEGESVPVTIDVSNDSRRARPMFRVTDDFLGPAFAIVDSVPPSGTRSYVADRTGARRGLHEAGACVLETGFPFDVLRVRRELDVASPIVVYPKTFDAQAWRLRGPSGWPAPSSVGDVSSVRDYRPGDPLRHIHWRSVARRGQLVVREFDREVRATTAVFADVPDDPDTADAVATVACSIALVALRDGEVVVGGDLMRSADAVLDWGARLAPGSGGVEERLAGMSDADAVVYVGPHELAPIEPLRSIASARSVSVVLVNESHVASDAANALRAAGATVAVVARDEVETWFESGCRAS